MGRNHRLSQEYLDTQQESSRTRSHWQRLVKRSPHVVRWVLTLLEEPDEANFCSYSDWQHNFMHKRLSLGLGLGLLYFLGFTLLDVVRFLAIQKPLDAGSVVNLLTALSMLACLLALQTPTGSRYQGIAFLGLAWSVTIITEIPRTLAGTAEPDLKGWTMLFFAQATIIPFRWRLHLLSQLGVYAYYFGVNGALGSRLFPQGSAPSEVLFDMIWISAMPNLVVYLCERSAKTEFWARRKLREEQRRSERLLLNILPQSVAQRLMSEHLTIADNFSEVTVLFTDIVNFTRVAAEMSPAETVDLLNQIFSMFDQLAEQYGLEKIKTIGDAYMVVAGLPQHRHDHASAIADMALAMQKALADFNQKTGQTLSTRTGIHTGPVIAGVIGLKKFAYDLWGDTVNTASRMESHGLPGEIQVSRITYECLKHYYIFEERGTINIKGKGEMMTYLLKSSIAGS